MALTLEALEALRERIKDAPPAPKETQKVNKMEAIRAIRKDIESMQKRGYSFDDIAKFLSEGGLQITTPTLKSYMQRTKPESQKTFRKPKDDEKNKASSNKNEAKKEENKASGNKNEAKKEENKASFSVTPDSEI